MHVELENLTKQFGDLIAVDDVSLSIDDGEFVTLVGPSGCGKTTTLRMIAGLETPTNGRIQFDGDDVTDLSVQKRDIAFVFQDYALYPHMTARKNMRFALEDGGMPDDEIVQKVEETAEMLGIPDHLDKRPGQLSGGQQQRVALGRSIVRDPDIFLLDEPLSNLDAKLRIQMRAELQRLHQLLDTTMVYVTHDQEEAMTMSDRVVIMNDGTIQQVSPPAEAYNQPRNRFVAEFIGSPSMNFLQCHGGDSTLRADPFTLQCPERVAEDAITELGVRPEHLELVKDPSQGQASAEVLVFEQVGAFNQVYIRFEGHEEDFVAQVGGDDYFEVGETVGVSLDPNRIHLFAGDGQAVYHPQSYEETPAATE